MKNIKRIITVCAVVIGMGAFALVPTAAGAVNVLDTACTADPQSVICQDKGNDINVIIKNVVNTLLFLLGVASVIVIIIAGIMYTTSGGDSGSVTKAKNMLLYAIIGLVVAFLAYAIVNWVIGRFTTPAPTPAVTAIVAPYNAYNRA